MFQAIVIKEDKDVQIVKCEDLASFKKILNLYHQNNKNKILNIQSVKELKSYKIEDLLT